MVTVRSVKIHIYNHIFKRPASFPTQFGRGRGGLVKLWFKFCVLAAKQLFVWPIGVSFNFSEFKFEAFRPSAAWFASYKQIKFLRQNLTDKFEGGRSLQNSANLPSNLICIFQSKKAVLLFGRFYVVIYVYILG